MGALNSVPFCSRTAADDNNNLGDRPDLNLSEDEGPACAVVQAQPEATSTPKTVRVEESGDVAIVHNTHPPRVQSTPPLYNSMDGDSGLEHSGEDEQDNSSDERLSQIDSNELSADERLGDEVDLNGTLSEDNEEEIEDKDKTDTNKYSQQNNKDKIDFAQLEEEILGDDMVEPETDTNDETNVDDLDITESKHLGVGKKNNSTTDMITDMLNQMVVDGGSRDIATR